MILTHLFCYQQLEFLGTLALFCSIVSYVFFDFLDEQPGILTNIKDIFTLESTLDSIIISLNLYELVILDPNTLIKGIGDYINIFERLRDCNKRNDLLNYFYNDRSLQRASSVLITIFGTVLINSKFNLDGVQYIFNEAVKFAYDHYFKLDHITKNPEIQLDIYIKVNRCAKLSYFYRHTINTGVEKAIKLLIERINAGLISPERL
ncbi:hypothetical protein K502DRAFT_351344 [Neoconidiobolus thromboides FSU 785]|nr:hypothetical protein K502DRAFT_351344 [Neoconidiobolus thromboides FSU 785]